VIQASVLELPFSENCFDAITTFQAHYHWPDILAAMHEVYRILKPGGQFILVAETYKIKYHMKDYNDIEKTRKLFVDSGFIDIELATNKKCVRVIGYK
jgi:ubiquinone/menaquinone biosynthesis C-methylase UbiE